MFHFFWESDSPFSQWYMSNFEVDSKQYNCAEQWMMAQKAVLFCDESAYHKIMQAKTPREQKQCGRNVQDFSKTQWDKIARYLVYFGNQAKFTQNPDILKVLLETEGELVEASPYDKIWGIGLKEDDPRALRKEQWLGTNWLGEVLTSLRDNLKKDIIFDTMEDLSKAVRYE